MNYQKLTGIVLKKQNYREADQIVTVWSLEQGKVRVMARGLRLGKSKLSFSMQDLGLVEMETAGRSAMPSLISAKPLESFNGLREELSRSVSALYAAELMLKMTADEQPNDEAYILMRDFLRFTNTADLASQSVFTAVDSFALRLLRCLGFSIEHAQSASALPQRLKDSLTLLMESEFSQLPALALDDRVARESHDVVRDFIEFILERKLKSDHFLASIL